MILLLLIVERVSGGACGAVAAPRTCVGAARPEAVRRVCGAHYTTLRRPRNRPAPLNFHDAAARRRAPKFLLRRVGARPGRLLLVGNRRVGLAFSLDAIPPLGQQWS